MTEANGNGFAGQKVTEITLDSGETVLVKPLSILHIWALENRAAAVFPYPDPTPYERAIDPAKTLEPGEVIPGTDHPAYRALCADIDVQRNQWKNSRYLLLTVEPGATATRAALIKKYAADIATMRGMMDLPEDAWEATLLYRVISSGDDYQTLLLAMQNKLLVTEEEIRDGWRIFRRNLQGTRPVHPRGAAESSGLILEKRLEPQPAPE